MAYSLKRKWRHVDVIFDTGYIVIFVPTFVQFHQYGDISFSVLRQTPVSFIKLSVMICLSLYGNMLWFHHVIELNDYVGIT